MSQSIAQKFTPISFLKFSLPSIIMMAFLSFYTIIDGIFISRYVGSNALSASNIVYPVINILLAIAVMIASGGNAVISKKLGEGKIQESKDNFSFFIVTGLAASIILLVITIAFLTPICKLLGASDLLLPYCKEYLRTTILFAPATMLQALFQTLLVTAGKPHLGLILTVLGGITNAVLDYLFMGPLGLGVTGAALATGIGQLIPAIAGMIYFYLVKGDLHFVRFTLDFKSLRQACLNGSSEMVTNLSNAVVTLLFNLVMMRLVGEAGVASITIILYAQFLFNSMYMGFSMGAAPIIGFNYGSKNKTELQNIYKICTRFILGASILIAALSFCLADLIVRFFVTPDSDTYALALTGFRIFSITYLFSGFNIFSSSLFTALSDGKTSAIISFTRTFLCIVISLLVLPMLLGINGVWLAIPIAEFIAAIECLSFLKQKNHIYGYMVK
ncbi:MAG: MATE family efflux transporter [bacterium]|nr:MATE family efflux transporter [bacterium]